jgi:hypothetical protein
MHSFTYLWVFKWILHHPYFEIYIYIWEAARFPTRSPMINVLRSSC